MTGHITDLVPREKSRALCPGVRFPPRVVHQEIITGQYVHPLKMALDADMA